MNHIAKKPRFLLLGSLCWPALACLAAGAKDDALAYKVHYELDIRAEAREVAVTMRVEQQQALLREVSFPASPRISKVSGDGRVIDGKDDIVWNPPAKGGELQWTVDIPHKRNSKGHDAWLTGDWGIFRAEDVIPRAATRSLRGAFSKTSFSFALPKRWTAVTAYREDENRFAVDKPDRRFDQPDGWIAVGRLGVRREEIAGMHVAVAGPTGHSLRRMDTLAMLHWTLPELSRLLDGLPERLTIVSAGSPMWRGGLSAPNSLYVHADRPMISENATSTLLHEVMHSALRLRVASGYDWIVEGVAEYYSLELLRRSRSISESRFTKAMAELASWSESADKLCQRASNGATTALAVTVMSALDAEIRQQTKGTASLDDLVKHLQTRDKDIDLKELADIAQQITGKPSAVLQPDKLPGCSDYAE